MHITVKTNEELEKITKENDLVLLDCFATWCGPCKMLSVELEKLENEMPELVIAKVDVDESPDIAIKFQVQAIPNIFLFKNGELKGSKLGYLNINDLRAFVKA